ncbi:hypothetical protein Verru16b_01645 [Lacunisphaera limnophila]|uniref:Uncharacterized protein n=1 Tax=Lacunisphaera limnophila TaxID=1838286 RepID=A0A1D8AUL0_9BACT|nr:hypothetical protein [Lacunisphaera limnophila]AOS44582.1 hypothetical protein Verru16b_01645 [Lacunisphaera limnophila]
MDLDHAAPKPPGFLWIIILGVTGFAAGFFGPMVFIPESNLGPVVGILFSGPAGLGLGLLLYVVFRFLPLPARGQWVLLATVATAVALATLLYVQPEPATRGYVLELEIRGTRPAAAVTAEVVADWQKRIATVTWAAPRAGWEQQMRDALAADRGRVLDAVLIRQRPILQHRKPWNRGRLFAGGWETKDEPRTYYFPAGSLPAEPGPAGTRVTYFLAYDSTARIQAPEIWPPVGLADFIGFSPLQAVPAEYEGL